MSGALAPRLRRVCLVVDIEAYGGRPYRVQQTVQERLDRALDHACDRAGVDRARCEAQDRGDGQLLLLPPGVDEAKALPGLVLGLRDALHTLNRAPGTAGRLRIRAALAQGGVQRAALGFVARSVETACRLLDCPQARAALKGTPDTDLALVVADDLFTDAFAAGAGGLPVKDFTPITVALPEKRFRAEAWIGTPRGGTLVTLAPPPAPGAGRRTGPVLLRGLGDALAGAALGAAPLPRHHDDPPQHPDGDPDHHHGPHGGGHHDGQHDDPWHPHDGTAGDPHQHEDDRHHDPAGPAVDGSHPHHDDTPYDDTDGHHDGHHGHDGGHHDAPGDGHGHGDGDGYHGDPFASPDHHDPGTDPWWHGPGPHH